MSHKQAEMLRNIRAIYNDQFRNNPKRCGHTAIELQYKDKQTWRRVFGLSQECVSESLKRYPSYTIYRVACRLYSGSYQRAYQILEIDPMNIDSDITFGQLLTVR